MRYRRLSHFEATIVRTARPWPFEDGWPTGWPLVLAHPRWRPVADTYETIATVEVIVELAGVDEDDVELLLFDDALVVQGLRRLTPGIDAPRASAGTPRACRRV
jgi:HSP20 family protein